MNNGLRYIKELLLHHSNFYMNKCWMLLQESGVDVYTVKTDAFTIPSALLEEAEELLNWDTVIGSWRFSRSYDIKYPDADNFLALKANTMKSLREYPVRPNYPEGRVRHGHDMQTL